MRHLFTPLNHLFALAVLSLAACAALPRYDSRALAERDHLECAGEGHVFPSSAYDGCRWLHQERRHRRTWENARLLDRSYPGTSGALDSQDSYRALPRAGFRCAELESGDGVTWIECMAVGQ